VALLLLPLLLLLRSYWSYATALASRRRLTSLSTHPPRYVSRARRIMANKAKGMEADGYHVDFTADEIDMGSEWAKRTVASNIELGARQKAAAEKLENGIPSVDAFGAKSSGMPSGYGGGKVYDADADDGADAGAEGTDASPASRYTWTQQEDDVEVVISLADTSASKAKDLKVTIKAHRIVVALRAEPGTVLCDVGLFSPCSPDACTWTVSEGGCVLSLEKAEAGSWASLGKDTK